VSDALSRAYVEIEPDFSEFNRSVDTGLRRATRLIESRIRGALANLEDRFAAFGREASSQTEDAFRSMADDAEDAADDITKAIRDIPTNTAVEIEIDVDGNQIRDEVRDEVRGVRPPRINIPIDVDGEGTFSRFLSSITGVRLPVAGFAALGTAAAAAGAAVVQMGAALAPAVGIVAGLPAAVGVGAAAIGTLQVATAGFGDAMSAAFDDTEAFEAAIEGLSPKAQAAAEAFRAVVPELQALQDSVQDAFFAEFDDIITNVAASLLGPLSDGMRVAAEYAGNLVAGLLNVAGSESGVNFVTSSFETLNGILSQLAVPVANLFTAFLDLGTAVSTAFGGEEAGAGLAAMIQQFADFIANATASGEALAWVENAMTVFEQLGAILSPIVGIIGSIGGAASATGGNILGVFGQALQVFDDFLASAQGQEVLITLFDALNQVGASFGTVLTNIAPALPPIISGISSILGVVTPLLGPLSELVGSVLGALAPILGIVAAAIQPLIAPLTTIITILGEILVGALESVMPLIEVLADLLGSQLAVVLEVVGAVLEAVAPIFTVLFEALGPIIEALAPLYELLAVVADIVGAVLGPIIQVLGDILLWLVEQVIVPFVVPVIEFLAGLLTGALGTAINWLVEQFQLAGAVLEVVWTFIKETIVERAAEMSAGFDALVALFKRGWTILNNNVFTPIKSGINVVKSVVTSALDGIKSGWNVFVGFIKGIPGKISGALGSLFSPLADGFKTAINSVISGWNNLSFSVPSVDLGPLGSVGGFTVSTPNIPMLQTGGFTTAQGLALLHPDEMVLPLSNSHGINALADALSVAGAGVGSGDITVIVKIGERELTDIIGTEITENNRTLTRRARAVTGRR
jgi:phage-related protein